MPEHSTQVCPDCCAYPGEQHIDGCDVERCLECGTQRISCDCSKDPDQRVPWSGEWPGVRECREYGWYAKLTGQGWTSCHPDEPGAHEDLNRLHVDAVWDREKARFIQKEEANARQ
jgi:hypothetical protein